MELNKLLELYLQEKPQLSPRTIEKYASVLKIFIKETGVNDVFVDRNTCIQWRNEVLRRSSAANANNYHRHLKALFSMAVEVDTIEENVFRSFKMLKITNVKPKTIDYNDLEKLLQLIETDQYYSKFSWFYLAMLDMLSYTAIRRRQLIGIRWYDINFRTEELYLSAKFSKNGQDNKIPLNPVLIDRLLILKKHLKNSQSGDQVFNITKFIDSYTPNESGETTEQHISGLFSRLSKKLDVLVSPHRFRHTFATQVAQNGGDLKTLSEFLTHSDTRTTMMYIHPDMDSKRTLQNIMSKE